jgi:hypothetical protein
MFTLNSAIMKQMASLDLSKYITNDQDLINRKFMGACRRGDLDVIKLLLTSPAIPLKPQLSSISEEVFRAASSSGDLEIFQFLEVVYQKNDVPITIPSLHRACRYANYEMIAYLCQYHNQKEIEGVFHYLFINDDLDTLVYLMQVVEKEFTHEELEDYFQKIVIKAFGSSEKTLHWMLLEQNLLVTDNMRQWLYEQPKTINVVKAIALLEKRDLKNKMEKVLGEKATVKQTNKI